MNFDEAARTFQMTPPPNGPNFMTASFDLHYNMNLHPKASLHSRSNTISDDDFGIKLKAQSMNHKEAHEVKTPVSNVSNSDTYDDDMDTETEDYLSDPVDDEEDEMEDDDEDMDEDMMMMYGEDAPKKDESCKKPKARRKPKSRLRSRTLSRPKSSNIHFLRIPNESDDNFDDYICDDGVDIDSIQLPPTSANKLHIRSYSESNIQKTIQNNQWPSSASSEDSFDFDAESNADSTVYSRYVSMKKKYKKQRRISRQFQEAITVIQDDNEDVMQMNEDQIRSHFEKEYEMKLIELEHEKLNTSLNIEDKMKQVLLRNDELVLQNKQLQQQVVAQVAMIQEQQQISLHQQRQFVAMQSSPSNQSPSPFHSLSHFPSTQPFIRRVSSTSTANNNHHKKLGLTPMSSNGESYTLNDDVASVNTDITYDYNGLNMEPATKYTKKQKKYQISKRKKLKELEKRVCQSDAEMAQKIGLGQSPWNRFLDLMTPSFCSCSPTIPPAGNQQKSIH